MLYTDHNELSGNLLSQGDTLQFTINGKVYIAEVGIRILMVGPDNSDLADFIEDLNLTAYEFKQLIATSHGIDIARLEGFFPTYQQVEQSDMTRLTLRLFVLCSEAGLPFPPIPRPSIFKSIYDIEHHKLRHGDKISFKLKDGSTIISEVRKLSGDIFVDFSNTMMSHGSGAKALYKSMGFIKSDDFFEFAGKVYGEEPYNLSGSWPTHQGITFTQTKSLIIAIFKKLGGKSFSESTVIKSSKTTKDGQIIKVQRPTATVNRGPRSTGNRVQGRRSKTTIAIGHLGHQEITGI